MLNIVNSYIKSEDLFNKNSSIVLALSGGVDSTVLLDILIKLKYNIIIAHVNHNKRLESKIEEESIRLFASKFNIPIEVLNYKHTGKNNFHSDAHVARYDFYKFVCDKYKTSVIATAHHMDDNIETVILNLMSGSNLYGYAGISSKVKTSDYTIVRPLLCLSKEDIIKYSKENNLVYFEDSSNDLDDYKRNRIRHKIVPLLKEECPDILDKTFSYSKQLKNAFSFIRKMSINYLIVNNNNIDITSYKNLDNALRYDILCLLLEEKCINKSEKILDQIDKMLLDDCPQKEIKLSNNNFFIKRYKVASIVSEKKDNMFNYSLDLEQKVNILDKYLFYLTTNLSNTTANHIKLCYNKLNLPLLIRNRKDEDVIEMTFGHKKIKDLFIDLKLPMEKRNSTPIITDSIGNILWVYDYAKSKSVFDQKDNFDIYLVCEVK